MRQFFVEAPGSGILDDGMPFVSISTRRRQRIDPPFVVVQDLSCEMLFGVQPPPVEQDAVYGELFSKRSTFHICLLKLHARASAPPRLSIVCNFRFQLKLEPAGCIQTSVVHADQQFPPLRRPAVLLDLQDRAGGTCQGVPQSGL